MGAGLAAELIIAVVATSLWIFTPDGIARNIFFFLATTSLVLSLLINMNPFLRFDGYFILSDWLDIGNLGPRSFALGRWWLREVLFGLKATVPEPLPKNIRRFLIGYAYCTWVYRFFLFLSIALFVYTIFPKVLGGPLVFFEIFIFIGLPIVRELGKWWKMRAEILNSRRSWFTASLLAGFIASLFYPWQSTIVAPAVLDSHGRVEIFVNQPARLEAIHVDVGHEVKQGDLLFELVRPDLNWTKRQANARLKLIDLQLRRRAADQQDLSSSLVLERQRDVQLKTLAGIAEIENQLTVRAPSDGHVLELDPSLHSGRWIKRGAVLATLGSRDAARIIGSVDGTDLARMEPGGGAYFIAEDPAYERLNVVLEQTNEIAGRNLDEPYLSSVYGGGVPVEVDAEGNHKTTKAHFMMTFRAFEPMHFDRTLRGSVLFGRKARKLF